MIIIISQTISQTVKDVGAHFCGKNLGEIPESEKPDFIRFSYDYRCHLVVIPSRVKPINL